MLIKVKNDKRQREKEHMTITNFGINPEQLKKAHSARECNKERPVVVIEGKIQKYRQVLPETVVSRFTSITNNEDRNNYIKALYSAGWSGKAIGIACKISAARVYQIISDKKEISYVPATLAIPTPPRQKSKQIVEKKYKEPSPEMLDRMRELQPLAQLVRSNSPRYRAEAEEYTYLLNQATEQGITVYRLAKLLGVTHSALAFRMVRYGYRTTVYGQTKSYKPVNLKNRAIISPSV